MVSSFHWGQGMALKRQRPYNGYRRLDSIPGGRRAQ